MEWFCTGTADDEDDGACAEEGKGMGELAELVDIVSDVSDTELLVLWSVGIPDLSRKFCKMQGYFKNFFLGFP